MQRPLSGPTVALAAVGLGLALLAATWHLGLEAGLVAESRGPVLAFLLDGLPPLGLVYGAYRLERSDLSAEDGWTVVRWTVAGALVFTLAIGLTMLVRQFEGRSLAEPAFELLVAADAGALSGAVAGYYSARARHDAARARRTRYALGFVNRLLRHDVRNDLNVVRGHAQDLAAYEGGDPGHVRETAAVVDRRAAAMNDLVDGTG
ncbi:MAG: histidine kinase, partial [Haloferacaceae archaeon]